MFISSLTPDTRRLSISHHQMAMFECPYKWHLQEVRGIKPSNDSAFSFIGRAVHAVLAAYNLGQKMPYTAVDLEYAKARVKPCWQGERQAELDSAAKLALGLAKNVVEFVGGIGLTTAYSNGVPLVEYSFSYLIDSVRVTGRVDWVAVDEWGKAWLVDFKTTNAFRSEDDAELDLQQSLYQAILQKKGIPVIGGMLVFIKNQLPAEPRLTKNGVSRMRIATTWEVYERAVRQAGYNPDDYLEMRDKLDCEFYRVVRVARSSFHLSRIMEEVVSRAKVMNLLRKGEITPYRNISFGCRFCESRDVCLEELDGFEVKGEKA